MAQVLMVLAAKDFRDEEYQIPRQIMEQAGFKVTLTSTTVRECRGRFGLTVKPDIQIEKVNPDNYDAIIFVGGPGAEEYYNHFIAHELIQKFNALGKVIGAICIAPMILGRAGILQGKNVTAYISEAPKLKQMGAKVSANKVEKDKNIVTANGPEAAKEFGEILVKAVNEYLKAKGA
jgi:protease I